MKHEYTSEVSFKRKELQEGDTVKVVSVPDAPMTDSERAAIAKAVGQSFTVIAGDEYGAMIQLDYFAPTFVDITSLQRTA
ncbi:hypothetical protein D3C80_1110130 [compost metagenome]